MTNGKLFERIVWTQGTNQIVLNRFMNAEYSVSNGTIEIDYADATDEELLLEGERSEEIASLINSDDYIEGESFELLGFEQTAYTLEEAV